MVAGVTGDGRTARPEPTDRAVTAKPGPGADIAMRIASCALRAALTSLRQEGFAWLDANRIRRLIERSGASAMTWAAFVASYDSLEPDTHMGDGGRYRLRRYAAFAMSPGDGAPVRLPHRPHRQSLTHNALNGGIDRWFAPIEDAIAAGPVLRGLLELSCRFAVSLQPAGADPVWDVEVHQFRIVGLPDSPGLPTPEGMHRDGVDFVFIMMVGRRNTFGGISVIQDPHGGRLAELFLNEPGDTLVIDDRRVMHGVTPIQPIRQSEPATRDALVVTFRRIDT